MFYWLKSFLEKLDAGRDRLFFIFIKKYWPRRILPNHLTVLRMILALYIIYLLFSGFENKLWLMVIFVFAAFLDLLDGSVARCLDEATDLGVVLDVVADKLLILPLVLFILATADLWLLLFLLILPELISGVMVIYYRMIKKSVRPTIFSKIKMVAECVAFAIIFFFDFPNPPSIFPVVLLYAGVLLAFMHIILYYLNPPPVKNA
jgi:phosphatidylglycerophosphate synthase